MSYASSRGACEPDRRGGDEHAPDGEDVEGVGEFRSVERRLSVGDLYLVEQSSPRWEEQHPSFRSHRNPRSPNVTRDIPNRSVSSILANTAIASARGPFVMKVSRPETTRPVSVRRATVRMQRMLKPAPGSVIAVAMTKSPTRGASLRSCCSGLPKRFR